jgi:hypothetical protein
VKLKKALECMPRAHELVAEKKGGVKSYSAACLVVGVIAARQRQQIRGENKFVA